MLSRTGVSDLGLRLPGEFCRQEIDQRPHRRQQAATRGKYRLDAATARRPIRQHVDERAIVDILADHHGRKLDDADALKSSKAQLCYVIGYQAGSMWHVCRCTVRSSKAPCVIAMRRTEIEAWKRPEIGRQWWTAQALDQCRTGDQPLRAVAAFRPSSNRSHNEAWLKCIHCTE